MEKKEAKKIIKEVLKKYGFHPNKIGGYKILDDDYLIGMDMTHSTYCKGYMMDYGAIYLPDEEKMPFRGIYDWRGVFLFTKAEGDDLRKYKENLLNVRAGDNLSQLFEYGIRTPEEFKEQLEINIEVGISRLYDKNFILDYYRRKMDDLYMEVSTNQGIEKMVRLGGYDLEEIMRRKRLWEKSDFETLYGIKEQTGEIDDLEREILAEIRRQKKIWEGIDAIR